KEADIQEKSKAIEILASSFASNITEDMITDIFTEAIHNKKDIEDIAVEEYIYGNGVAIIEWAEKIKAILPKKHISVKFKIKGENKREIDICS
ncbi:MAG: tRNA (adenosine(37)-N6)-threonylcarbamoyltransferase complex ATPase subunit type 1 TsaE, partial [Candidatus Omnitrophica bacterium]|nr:tRNA (adenosine(37)-N6)-threonylcarbamoyltransferase complex ATPase subunit type 1 TsaE [Candidatus Omnitrophota bacterium]